MIAGRGKLKGLAPLHKGLFFTMSLEFAKKCAGPVASCSVYRAALHPDAHVLDISDPGVTCTFQESEQMRHLVAKRRQGERSIQCEFRESWEEGWRTGAIMSYSTRPGGRQIAYIAHLAVYDRHTDGGQRVMNMMQIITRQYIEDIVEASIEAGYQAVVGNERQDGETYPVLIVLDPNIITFPVKIWPFPISNPNNS